MQQHLLDQNLVGFLLQEISREADQQPMAAGSITSAAMTPFPEAPRLTVLLQISQPPSRNIIMSPKSFSDLKYAPEAHMQQSSSPKIAAQYPSRPSFQLAESARRMSRAASSLKAANNAFAMPSVPGTARSQSLEELKFPPGFVSSGDLEEDLDRLMELDNQVCNLPGIGNVNAFEVLALHRNRFDIDHRLLGFLASCYRHMQNVSDMFTACMGNVLVQTSWYIT